MNLKIKIRGQKVILIIQNLKYVKTSQLITPQKVRDHIAHVKLYEKLIMIDLRN